MTNISVQCCLVSNHLLPNVIPLLDTISRPDEVHLFETAEVSQNANRLAEMCKSLGIRVQRYTVDPFSIETINASFLSFLEYFEGGYAELNVTGGTKIMALGAFEACRGVFDAIFYIDTQNDRRIDIAPQQRTLLLPDVLTVQNCLRAYGYTIHASENPYVSSMFREATALLVREAQKFQKPLRNLNYYAAQAASQHALCVDMQPDVLDWKSFCDILNIFQKSSLLDWDRHGRLIFAGENERFFVNGGWLEQHVFSVLLRFKHEKIITDVLANIEVVSNRGVKNEIDVAFTARNRLFLVECKTQNFQNSKQAQNAIYKLQALRPNLSGLYGKAVFISFSDLPKSEKKRCFDNEIEVVESRDIYNLPMRIKSFIYSA